MLFSEVKYFSQAVTTSYTTLINDYYTCSHMVMSCWDWIFYMMVIHYLISAGW